MLTKSRSKKTRASTAVRLLAFSAISASATRWKRARQRRVQSSDGASFRRFHPRRIAVRAECCVARYYAGVQPPWRASRIDGIGAGHNVRGLLGRLSNTSGHPLTHCWVDRGDCQRPDLHPPFRRGHGHPDKGKVCRGRSIRKLRRRRLSGPPRFLLMLFWTRLFRRFMRLWARAEHPAQHIVFLLLIGRAHGSCS